MIDLVRKSSGVINGVVRLEKDFAADLKARNDAVRFDLNADFRRGASISMPPTGNSSSCFSDGLWKTLKSSSSTSISRAAKGWSSAPLPPMVEESDCIRRDGSDFLPRDPGV